MKKIYAFVLVIIVLVSCSEEQLINPPITYNSQRTLLVYLAGDNNLSTEVQDKLEALKEGWNESLGELLIFSDTFGNKNPVLLHLTQSGNEVQVDTLRHYENTNSACTCVLKQAIADMQTYAPSAHYGLITFSHATGWLPAGAFEDPYMSYLQTRSLIVDGEKQMDFSDFVQAIPDKLFDFMIFDMCFMANVETTYALRNKTSYIIASSAEILSPGFTPVYESSLSKLYQPKPDLKGFAMDFFNYFDSLTPPYRSATITLLGTKKMEALAQQIKERSLVELVASQIRDLQAFDRKSPHLFFDFKEYCKVVVTDIDQTALGKTLDEIVLYKSHTDQLININIAKHSGLTVYIMQPELSKLNKAYKETEWSKAIY